MALVWRANAVCVLGLLASAPAASASATDWSNLTGADEPGSTIAEPALARGGAETNVAPADSLHFFWTGMDGATVRNTIVDGKSGQCGCSGWEVFTYQQGAGSIAVVALPDGSLRAFFTGLDGGSSSPYDSMVATATSANGATWVLQPTAASDSTPAGSVAKGTLGATLWGNGTPMSIWGDQYRGYHVGVSDQTPDVTSWGSDRTATVYGPNAATDSATGAVAIAWNDFDTARTEVAFVQPTTNPWFPPGATMDVPGSVFGGPDRVEITGRSGGAAGIFIAYLQGAKRRPAIWRIGDFPPMTLTKQSRVFYPGVARSQDGRIWGFWHEGHTTGQTRRIFARRSNKQATKFGETVVVDPPQGTNDGNVWSLEGEGTAPGGALDLVALIEKPKPFPTATQGAIDYYITRVPPGITLQVKKLDNGGIQFTTLDAGDKLAAKVKFNGHSQQTGPDGKVTFAEPKDPGKYTAKATRNGYTPTSRRVKIR